MNYRNQNSRSDDRKEENPYSRIFVVCNKKFREENLRVPFEGFGSIEDLYMPKDRKTGQSKGVAYIKYSKTSSAAAAIEAMHLRTIGTDSKSVVKVMIASDKNESNDINESKYRRLFIKIPKQATEIEIRDHFSNFGQLESIHIQRDKVTEESKGFAYVKYKSFLGAAKAFEGCDRTYRPVFATPKDEVKKNRNGFDYMTEISGSSNFADKDFSVSSPIQQYYQPQITLPANFTKSILKTNPDGYKTVNASCTPQVPRKCFENLFNIVPGMINCQYTVDPYNGLCKAVVTYEEETAAAHAVERLNNFEFPSGEIVSVKPLKKSLSIAATELSDTIMNFKTTANSGLPDFSQLANIITKASELIQEVTSGQKDRIKYEEQLCNVLLPPPQPLVSDSTRVARRCFIVCKPQPPPLPVLRDVFCRFGDLIDVATFPNKTFGFAKYASNKAAQEAINTLDGAMVYGAKLKVLEADEKRKDNETKMDIEVDNDPNVGRKRKRVDDKQ